MDEYRVVGTIRFTDEISVVALDFDIENGDPVRIGALRCLKDGQPTMRADDFVAHVHLAGRNPTAAEDPERVLIRGPDALYTVLTGSLEGKFAEMSGVPAHQPANRCNAQVSVLRIHGKHNVAFGQFLHCLGRKIEGAMSAGVVGPGDNNYPGARDETDPGRRSRRLVPAENANAIRSRIGSTAERARVGGEGAARPGAPAKVSSVHRTHFGSSQRPHYFAREYVDRARLTDLRNP